MDRSRPRIDFGFTLKTTLRDPWRVLAAISSGISLFALSRRWFGFDLNGVLQIIHDSYVQWVRWPIAALLGLPNNQLTAIIADGIALYMLIGALCTRTYFIVFVREKDQPAREETVGKRLWSTVRRLVRSAALGLVWPISISGYILRRRYIWVQYVDHDDGGPDYEAPVFTVISTERNVSAAFPDREFAGYNAECDKAAPWDTWFVLAGDFRQIFAANAFVAIMFVALLTLINVIIA